MTPDLLFQIANPLALVGWLALAFSPLAPRAVQLIAGWLVPLALSAGYTAIVMAFWTSTEGGFDSLENVALLFESRWLLLAGWVHYLAFDLLIGAWAVRVAQRELLPHLLVLPCLAATFLFGPAGFLMFQALRLSLRGRPGRASNGVTPN